MLAAPNALPSEQTYMYYDLEFAKNPKGLSSNGRLEREDAS